MLYELLKHPETDIIGALENKLVDNPIFARFHEDPRVAYAFYVLQHTSYDFSPGMHNIINQLEFLDDVFVKTCLMYGLGLSSEAAEERREVLSHYNPFKSSNPVVKVFAYCECIEGNTSSADLEYVAASLDFHVGTSDDPVFRRSYPVLRSLLDKRLSFVQKKERFELQCHKDIEALVEAGDALALDCEFMSASDKYSRASEIARYQLSDDGLADDLSSRLKSLSACMLADLPVLPGESSVTQQFSEDPGRRGPFGYIRRGVLRCYEGIRSLFKKAA